MKKECTKLTQVQNALVEKNLRLVAKAARRPNQFSMTYDERYSIGCEALMSAATTYKPDKGSFSSHFNARFNARIINAYQRDYNPKSLVSLDAPCYSSDEDCDSTLLETIEGMEPDILDAVIERETIRELRRALAMLSPVHKAVILMRYLIDGGATQRDTARRLRKSKTWVAKKENEALSRCRRMLVC